MSDVFKFPQVDASRGRVPVYGTPLPKERDEKQIRAIAERFGITGKSQDKGHRTVIKSGRMQLELFHASDSIWMTMLSASGSEPARAVKLPPEGEAIKAADDYLRRMGMSDKMAAVRSVTYSEVARVEKGRKDNGESRRIALHVNYGFSLDNLPVMGPGAKIQVTFTGPEKISEAYKFWREPKADGEIEIISPEDAMQMLRRDPVYAELRGERSQVMIRSIRLGYYAMPPREAQERLMPVYAFEGTVSTPEFERYDFVRYLSAARMTAPEAKRRGLLIGNGSPVAQLA